MKKKSRRSQAKYPALYPQYNLKTRTELFEIDYLNKLNDKEKAWLNSFNEEYVNANFTHDGKKIQRRKSHKKDSYDRNNARNRDILTKAKASGNQVILTEKVQITTVEDMLINKIDESRKPKPKRRRRSKKELT